MPCENYKDALIEAAANCTDLANAASSDPHLLALRAHLESCASCRAIFEQEQSLFAAIDAGLYTAANAQAPPSLLPRVRARLDEVSVAPRLQWQQPLVFTTSSIALAFLIFLAVRPPRVTPKNIATQIPVIIPIPATSEKNNDPQRIRPKDGEAAISASSHPLKTRNSTNFNAVASSNPEVLVPPNERESLARFVSALNERGDLAKALVAKVSEKKDEPVRVNPLQIADVEIKPLTGTETESPDRDGETH